MTSSCRTQYCPFQKSEGLCTIVSFTARTATSSPVTATESSTVASSTSASAITVAAGAPAIGRVRRSLQHQNVGCVKWINSLRSLILSYKIDKLP